MNRRKVALVAVTALVAIAANRFTSRLVGHDGRGRPDVLLASMAPIPQGREIPEARVEVLDGRKPIPALKGRRARANVSSLSLLDIDGGRTGGLVAFRATFAASNLRSPFRARWVARLIDADGETIDEAPIGRDFVVSAGDTRSYPLDGATELPPIPGTIAHLALVDAETGNTVVSTHRNGRRDE